MKSMITLFVNVLLGFTLAAGAYAVEGKTDAGGAAGQPSTSTGKKTESSAQPAPGPIISPGTAGHIETIEGELLRIEKDVYIVKDLSGREVTLKVDKDTKIDGNIAALALAACSGSLPAPPPPCRSVRFDAAGRILCDRPMTNDGWRANTIGPGPADPLRQGYGGPPKL